MIREGKEKLGENKGYLKSAKPNITVSGQSTVSKIAKLKNMTVIEEECYCRKSIINGKVEIEGKVFDAYDMTMFWLTNTNDSFYEKYGFNWVPPADYLTLVKEVRDSATKIQCSIQLTSGIDYNNISDQIRNIMIENDLRNSL